MERINLEFILDEAGISVSGKSMLNDEYACLVGIIGRVRQDGFPCFYLSQIWETTVCEEMNFANTLYSKDSKLDKDILRALILPIEKMAQISYATNSTEYAKEKLSQEQPIALLVCPEYERVEPKNSLHYIASENALLCFYRKVPEYANMDEEQYLEVAKFAFPKLYFHEGLDIGNFDEKYPKIRVKLNEALGYLNDRFLETANRCSFIPNKIEADFKAKTGLFGISPEAGRTMNEPHRVRERTKTIRTQSGEKHILCEWHIKFRGDTDRVHFAFDRELMKLVDDKIFIGIFAEHLPV